MSLWNMHYCSSHRRHKFISIPQILSHRAETRHHYTRTQVVMSGLCSRGREPKQTIRSYNSMFHSLCSKKPSQAMKFPINPQVLLLMFPVCFLYMEIWACFTHRLERKSRLIKNITHFNLTQIEQALNMGFAAFIKKNHQSQIFLLLFSSVFRMHKVSRVDVKVRNGERKMGRSLTFLHIFKTCTSKMFSKQKS